MKNYKKMVDGYSYVRNDKYISDCNYYVDIDGTVLGFSKVSNLSLKMDGETYKEGGNNAISHTVEAGSQGTEVLILEKGFAEGIHDLIATKLFPGCKIEQLTIIVLKGKRDVARVFYFEEGTVTKRSFSNLNAASGEVLTISLEISHSGLIEEIG